MSTPVIFNSISYNVPAYGDTGYAQGAGNLSSYLIAIAAGTLQQSGGTFSLIADVNFGTGFGLLSKYFTSITANAATAGVIRLAHADTIDWRNNANSANLVLGVNSSDQLTYQGAVIPTGGASFVASIMGTANEIIASSATGAVTLSTPQAIGTSSTPTFGGLTTNGVINSNGGILVSSTSGLSFSCTTSGTLSFDAPAGPISSYALILPTSIGGTGQVLTQTNSPAGQLGWATPAAGTVTSVSGTANQITSTGGATPVLAIANPLTTPGGITATGNISAGTNTLIGRSASLGTLAGGGSVDLVSGGTGNDILIAAPNSVLTSYSLSLPINVGSSGQVLTTTVSGSTGALSWATPAAGTVTSVGGTSNQITSTGGAMPVLALASPLTTPGAATITGTLAANVGSTFGNAASPSATTLNYYGEGTFTPVLNFGGATTGITYGTQSGRYTRIGRMVQYEIRIILTNKGSATGSATITGLPFTAGSRAYAFPFLNAVGATVSNPAVEIDTTTCFLSQLTAGSQAALADTSFTNTTTCNFTGSFSV